MKRQKTRPDQRVVIAVPLASPLIYWRTVAAILEMERPDQADLMVFQGALVDRARNHLVERMLDHPIAPTHLLFLDADIAPAADTLTRLLKVNRPIVSGLYRKRLPPHEPMAFLKRGKGKNQVFEPLRIQKGAASLRKVDLVGAGCLLIRREVFEKLPPPWFTSEWRPEGHLSEDFSFCEKASAAGFDIFVDCAVRPLHLELAGIGTARDGSARFVPLAG